MLTCASVPKVLLQAKKEAVIQASEQQKCQSYQGPWDKGHWANRR